MISLRPDEPIWHFQEVARLREEFRTHKMNVTELGWQRVDGALYHGAFSDAVREFILTGKAAFPWAMTDEQMRWITEST